MLVSLEADHSSAQRKNKEFQGKTDCPTAVTCVHTLYRKPVVIKRTASQTFRPSLVSSKQD